MTYVGEVYNPFHLPHPSFGSLYLVSLKFLLINGMVG
jgi:hypothetical protein